MKKTITLLFAATAIIACKKEETKTEELDMSVVYPQTKKLIQLMYTLVIPLMILTVG